MPYIGQSPTQVAFLTDTFSGNGSTTAFTMSVAPATTTSVLVAISGVLQDPSTYSVTGTTLTFSAAPPSGTGNISARYLGIPASGVTTTAYRTITEFTATAGQTTFTPPSYTVGFIQVYRNGVLLGSADYTATNGTTVVLASGANSGDLVTTISFYVSSVLNAIPATAGSVGSTYLASNLTLGGTTNSASGITFGSGTAALASYATGSWTPDVYNSGASSTWTSKSGTYVKIGNICHAWYRCDGGNSGGGGGTLTLSNLPFTSAMGFSNASGGMWGTNGLSTNTGNIFFPGNTAQPNYYIGGTSQTGTATFTTGFLTYQTA